MKHTVRGSWAAPAFCFSLIGKPGRASGHCSLVIAVLLAAGCNTRLSPDPTSLTGTRPAIAREMELTAYWEPFGESKYGFAESWETLKNLRPHQAVRAATADELSVFLPPAGAKLGDVWELDGARCSALLKQLHPGATPTLHHFGPNGSYGCLAAENENYRLVRTRAHAEFEFPDGWFTPSQFAGEIVVDRRTDSVVALRLRVPARRNNVDLNWKTGEMATVRGPDGQVMTGEDGEPMVVPSIIADIGYCPRLELSGGALELLSDTEWHNRMVEREIDRQLQGRFYEFSRIEWLDWETAVARAQAEGKPLHVVALFGTLDDESC
jgi:hypothetical protein